MYCGRTTLEILRRRWRRDAVFEDPLSKCDGFDEYAAQWFALVSQSHGHLIQFAQLSQKINIQNKLFSESERASSRILSATLSPNRLIFAQTQVYTVRFIGLKKVRYLIIPLARAGAISVPDPGLPFHLLQTISSIILVDLDEDMKITSLVDQWNGTDLPTRWGTLFFRKMNAKLTPWLIRVPKDKPRAD